MDRGAYFRQASEALVVLQVEGASGVGALGDILAVPGVDIVFVGVYDLSQSLGVIGQVDHPDVLAALEQVADTCTRRGVACGTFVESPQDAMRCASIGMRYLCYSVDMAMLAEAGRWTMQACKPQDA
jgi:4-hydroxy-2-oxoheptanedioate aldolase